MKKLRRQQNAEGCDATAAPSLSCSLLHYNFAKITQLFAASKNKGNVALVKNLLIGV